MTFVLDATNKAIKFTITAGAGADVHFTSHWADATASGLTEGQTQGTSNGSTSVDVVPAPAASTRRVVKLITFHNTSTTTSRTVTLVNDVGGTSRTIAVFTLAPLATWYSDTAATTAIADGDKGDITVSGSGATWTIDNNAITTAKIFDANVTFAKIANITSGNLLGRTGAGAGPVQEIIPGSGVLTWLQTPTADNLRTAVTGDTGTGDLVFGTSPTITGLTHTGAATFSNTGNVVPLTVSNTGTANSFVVNDVAGDATPFIIDADGLVGIGVSAPLQPLHVGRSGTGVVARFTDSATMTLDYGIVANGGVYIDNANSGYIQFRIGGTTKLQVAGSGVITAADVYTTIVGATNRDVFIDNTGVLGYVSSTRASKTNIASLEAENVEWLQKLRPVSFFYKKRVDNGFIDEPDGTLDYGLIAEEAFDINPDLCFFDIVNGNPELRGISYSKLVTPLLRWVQILEQRVSLLEQATKPT